MLFVNYEYLCKYINTVLNVGNRSNVSGHVSPRGYHGITQSQA